MGSLRCGRLLAPLGVAAALLVANVGANIPEADRAEPDSAPQITPDLSPACIMNIRNMQQAMRSYQNMNGFEPGQEGLKLKELVGPDKFLEQFPECPMGGIYTLREGRFPEVGTLLLRCSLRGHVPEAHDDW